jgi:hypothetical protein
VALLRSSIVHVAGWTGEALDETVITERSGVAEHLIVVQRAGGDPMLWTALAPRAVPLMAAPSKVASSARLSSQCG